MTLRKKLSRRIVVDGTQYRWTISANQQGATGTILLIVEPEAQPSHHIALSVPCRDLWLDVGNVHPLDPKNYRPITPGIVRNIVLSAVALGWSPTQPGKQMAFEFCEDGTLARTEKKSG
jgi:hypothetical protein